MSGIAGWVDYQRDLSLERPTVRAMTATMSCRGPDGEEVWTSRHAAFGFRGQTLIDPASTAQPMVATAERQAVAVACLDGEVYNAPELRAELQSRGYVFRTRGDVEVVLNAYLAWGPQCAERLNGIYGIAIWDIRTEELVLIRDRFGNKPMFYAPTLAGVIIGSERKAILSHPLVAPAVDLDGLREILSYSGTPGHGIFRGISQVRPGHLVRVRRAGLVEDRYWALEGRPHTDDLETTITTIRELLEKSVSRQLTADVPYCVMLSGGLDSSGITALATKSLAQRGAGPLRTFTVQFLEEKDFRESSVWTPDGEFVSELVNDLGTEHSTIVVSTADLLDPVVRVNALRAKDVPSPLGNMNTSLYALCRTVREHVPLAILGDAADGIFGGGMWMSVPPLLHAGTFPWIALAQMAGAQHGMGTDLLDADLLAKLDMRGYCGDRYAEAMARVPHVSGQSAEERRMREIWYLNTTNWLETLLPHSESVAQSVGLALRLPYCDPDLVQYTFNAPWTMKSFDGREKSLLRGALRDVLPASILDRRKTPYPVTQDAAYATALCDELSRLLDDPTAPVAPLVDRDAARRVLENPDVLVAGPRTWTARTHVEMLFQLNMWLDLYRVRIVI